MAKVYTADFETCDDREFHDGVPHEVRVWLWAVCDIQTLATEKGTNICSFLEWLEDHTKCDIWFHNLAFDGTHIICALHDAGFEHSTARHPGEGEYTTLISESGKFYSICVGFAMGIVRIYDSLKKYPVSVGAIAKSVDVPETKGEIDYRLWRPEGYAPTPEELAYIESDVLITARGMRRYYDDGLVKMTIGSDCMSWYKDNVGGLFEKWFPRFSTVIDAQLRQAYRGGYTYVNPELAGVDVYGGISVDYNSMYPSMMLSKPFPYGSPRYFRGRYERDDDMPLYVQFLTCTFRVKHDGFPMIQVKSNPFFGAHEHVRDCSEPVEMALSSVDLALFLDNYDVEVLSYDGGYKFHARVGMFDDYIGHWSSVKVASEGLERFIAKLFLNNLYGKYGTNPDVTCKIPEFDSEGIMSLVVGEHEEREPVYVPVAIFATAWARDTLIRAAMANRDRFIYCDTDSLHLVGTEPPEGLPLDDRELCHWKVEGTFSRARHIRPKTYIWDLNGKIQVACAGMPKNIKESCDFDNFKLGFRNYDIIDGRKVVRPGLGKLVPKMVKGGRTLVDGLFEIR